MPKISVTDSEYEDFTKLLLNYWKPMCFSFPAIFLAPNGKCFVTSKDYLEGWERRYIVIVRKTKPLPTMMINWSYKR